MNRRSLFFNLPELISLFKESADIQTADMLHLPVPEAEYINEVLKPSPEQEDLVSTFADRAEMVRSGLVEPREDNMLKITNDGRKCALDQRLINDMLPDFPDSKVNRCVKNAFDIWQETAQNRSTQLIFCDLSTPKNNGTFNVYDDVREKLVAKGIPREEIAFIHEAGTEAKKRNCSQRCVPGKCASSLDLRQSWGQAQISRTGSLPSIIWTAPGNRQIWNNRRGVFSGRETRIRK